MNNAIFTQELLKKNKNENSSHLNIKWGSGTKQTSNNFTFVIHENQAELRNFFLPFKHPDETDDETELRESFSFFLVELSSWERKFLSHFLSLFSLSFEHLSECWSSQLVSDYFRSLAFSASSISTDKLFNRW